MERLLGTRRIRKDPEQEPLNYTKDRSTRGPQREEFAEHEDDNVSLDVLECVCLSLYADSLSVIPSTDTVCPRASS